MRVARQTWWRIGKAVLAATILVCVARYFTRLLQQPELWRHPLEVRPGWLVAAGLLYLAALGCWGSLWVRLLHLQHQPVSWPRGMRAYYVSQLGKYAPGKAWALVIRATLTAPDGVRPALAVMTGIYETLIAMAAGSVIALLVIPLLATADEVATLVPQLEGRTALHAAQAVGLLVLASVPILLVLLSRFVRRVAGRLRGPDATLAPPLPLAAFLRGLVRSSLGWGLLGASFWLLLQGLQPGAVAWSWDHWFRCTAYVALAYVAGFVILVAPGGLGVREFVLQQAVALELGRTLDPTAAGGLSVVVVLALRLVWTAAELLLAGLAFAVARQPVPLSLPGEREA